MKNKLKKFEKKEELISHIKEQLSELKKLGEFNIYTHAICPHRKDDSGMYIPHNLDAVEYKLNNILSSGFEIPSKYSALCATMRFLGNTNDEDLAEKIYDYTYDGLNNRTVCIFAFPKEINIQGKSVEFSSYDGESFTEKPAKLIEKYREAKIDARDPQTIKFCLLDTLIDKKRFFNNFLLGVEHIDEDNKKFEFLDPDKHYAKFDDAKHFLEDIEKLLIKKFERHNTTDKDELIIKEYIEAMKYIDILLDCEI